MAEKSSWRDRVAHITITSAKNANAKISASAITVKIIDLKLISKSMQKAIKMNSSIFKTFFISLAVIANTHFAYCQTASILPPAKTTFNDQNGKPLTSGTVDFYVPGTTTRKTTWQDSAESIPNTNPVTLDAAGRALILGDGAYRQIVKDRNGNLIWDQVTSSVGSGGSSGSTVGDGLPVGTILPTSGIIAPSNYKFAYGQALSRAAYPELLAAITVQTSIGCVGGTATINVSDTSYISVGAILESICASGSPTVISKTSSTVTLSINATITTSTNARFFPYGNGDALTTFNLPDLRGNTIAGRCNMGGVDCSNLNSTYFSSNPNNTPSGINAKGGSQSKTLVTANLPPQTPLGTVSSSLAAVNLGARAAAVGGTNDPAAVSMGNTAGASQGTQGGFFAGGTVNSVFTGTPFSGQISTPVSSISPTITLNYVIKVTPDSNLTPTFGVASIGGMTGIISCGSGVTCAGNTISFSAGVSSIQGMTGNISCGGTLNCSANNISDVPQNGPFTPTNASPAAVTIQTQLQRMPVMCETYSGGCTTANIQQAIVDAIAASRCFQFNGVYNTTTTVSIIGGNGNVCLTGKGGLKLTTAGSFAAVLELKNYNGLRVDGNIQLDCNSNAQIVSALKVWSSGPSAQYQDISFGEYSNCRQAIVIGDRSQSALPLSEIIISRGFFYNVARGIVAYSTNAVVGISNMQNVVDPHSSGAWAISGTATCTGTSVTITASAGYLDFYDILTGTGFPANTYVVNQTAGTLGGTGTYTVNQACTASSAAFTSETRGINVLVSGGFVFTNGGETINVATNNGYACVNDIMGGVYGACTFTGSAIEVGGSLAATFNPTGAVSPTGGGIQFINNRGFVGGLTTTDLITGDSTFPGNITVSSNFFFGTSARTGKNITANNAATPVYFDIVSFGTNMLQGYLGVSGGTQYLQGVEPIVSVVTSGTSGTQGAADNLIYFNTSGTFTYTLLPASRYPGRRLTLLNNSANAINSASSNVAILGAGGSPSTSIMGGGTSKFINLISTGSIWQATAAN